MRNDILGGTDRQRDYDADVTRAIRSNLREREFARVIDNPALEKKREHEERTRAFEVGDHQPDGTVLYGTVIKGHPLQLRSAASAYMRCSREGALSTGGGHHAIGKDEEVVSITVHLWAPTVDGQRLRDLMAEHPDWLERMFRVMQLHAAGELGAFFDVAAKPLE